MSAEVLYRKWRPRTFAEVAGQEAVVRTLTNALRSGKVAHAYLFSGPRGTGKTTMGRLLAKAVNCTDRKDGEPCNACPSCLAYVEGRSLDLVELDAASNRGIDEIRNLRERANYAPSGGVDAHKVYLVDEVHMLTDPAFNALLKTLEEPPAHVIFVLATTEAHKVPATVISRCQRFDFRRIPLAAVVDRLAVIAKEEGFDVAADALEVIARTATGSLRDGINLLEQLVDSYGKQLSLDNVRDGLGLVVDARSAELAALALRGDLAAGLSVISDVRDDGLDLRQFQRQVVAQLRGLLLVRSGAQAGDAWSDAQLEEMRKAVEGVSADRIVAALRAFGEADLRADPLSPLPLELALAASVLQPQAQEPAAAPAARPAPSTPRPAAKRAASPPRREASEPKAGPQAAAAPAADGPPEAGENGPAPAAPAAGEAGGRWQEIYQRTRAIDHKTGALLNSGCDIIESSDDELVFGFRHKMLLDRMLGNGGDHLRALQQAVDEVLGPGRTVRCVHEEGLEGRRPESRGGHLVRAAEELGGTVQPGADEGG